MYLNSRDSLFIFIITISSIFFFSAKVAVQIVDYYNLAANTLDLISSDECSVSEILGAKIYKVCARVTTAEMQVIQLSAIFTQICETAAHTTSLRKLQFSEKCLCRLYVTHSVALLTK